jgi:NAD(P)-dependent dehydrogenase (short-subunit alcohol dehydrogenase family)
MTEPEPRRRVVVTGSTPLAVALARGLAADRAAVVLLAADRLAGWDGDHVACDFRSEAGIADALGEAEARLGGLDQVVHAWIDPGLLVEHAFAEVDEARWARECEGSLEAGWWLCRHLSEPLRRSGGGSVAVVVPVTGLCGGGGYAMLATVAEGLRVLAKGCGRQWAAWGITVNTVMTAPHHWVPPEQGDRLVRSVSLSRPAFGDEGDLERDVAPLVAALADPRTHFLTAGTLVADGGVWVGL